MKQLFTTVLTLISSLTFSQGYLYQAIILNEGYFDYQTNTIIEPATIGSYDPTNQTYQIVDTLEGMRFASDLIIDGAYYYVAADTKIFKMDLNTHQEIASVTCVGVRNLGIYQNMLVATRGEYGVTFDSYLHVYNTNTMALVAAIDTVVGPKYATQNIIIDSSSFFVPCAFIAVNNGFEWGNEKGLIGKLNLSPGNLTYGNEVDLGPNGKNPDNLVKLGGFLYTVNNKDFSGSSISKVAINGTSNTTVNLAAASTGCGTSALRDNNLVYQLSMETTLNEFELTLMNNSGPVAGHTISYYELAQEPLSGQLYTSETDYFSFGKVHIFDTNNTELSNFNVGISPGTIVFDVRSAAGIPIIENKISVYPNPAEDILNVSVDGIKRIYDFTGKLFIESSATSLDIKSLNQGIYLLNVNGINQQFIKR
jgi:hypothetical protein